MHIIVVSASIRIDNVVAIEREGNVCIRSLIICIHDNDNIVGAKS